MNKIRKSLACPKCNASGNDIDNLVIDKFKEYKYDGITGFDIKRIYKCYCKKCMEVYEVEYGNAKLRQYNPPINGTCLYDVTEYVSYESEFDRSYRIVNVMGISMIIIEDDMYPFIIEEEKMDELIDNHKKTKKLVNNIWMNRYR